MKTNLAAVMAALSFLMAAGISGAFFGFSVGVMPGLNAAKASSAIESMQAINQKILNPLFLATFVLAPVTAAIAGVLLLISDQKSAGLLFLAAGAVYFLGCFLPTVVVNVPMNNTLDTTAIPTDPAQAAQVWSDYSGRWTTWNTIRGAFSGVSVLLLALGTYIWGKNA
ncbi:DUF1772 domain-containing protein [Spirillospora sp. CA-294931]|uniref:anthrone oxygenase family protein n=1 Tax=Spirillospora sp. CA-294931 TaxID=3240042 RepID=UPI003D90F55E